MAFQGPLIVGNQESFTLGSFTTAQRDGLTGVAEGTLIYNNTEYKPQVYSNSAWGKDRKSTRLNSSHSQQSRMPSSA